MSKVDWFKLLHPSKYLAEQQLQCLKQQHEEQLEYLKELLAQTNKQLADANEWIRDSKAARQIVLPAASTPAAPVERKLTNWEQYRQRYREDLETLESIPESEAPKE